MSFADPHILNSGASNGELLVGNSSGQYTSTTLTSGKNMNITNNDGGVTVGTTDKQIIGTNDGARVRSVSLVVTGVDDTVSGPNVEYFIPSSDQYPIRSDQNVRHNNSGIFWDAYWSTGGWTRSHTSIPYGIRKHTDKLIFYYGTAGAVATNFTFEPALTIDSNKCTMVNTASAKLDIGTGGTTVRTPMLRLVGPDHHLDGPHAEYYVGTGQYPVRQDFNARHDNINLTFDGYWNSSSWNRSHTTTPYSIMKNGNKLKFSYGSDGTAGSAFSFNTGFELSNTGVVNFTQTPTIAGSSVLTQSSTSNTVSATGCINGSFTINIRKIGNVITAHLTAPSGPYTSTSLNGFSLLGIIPAGYRPINSFSNVAVLSINGPATLCFASVSTGGDMLFFNTSGNFPSGTTIDITDAITFSWISS